MGKQQQQQKSGGGEGARHRRSGLGVAGPQEWDGCRLREPGQDTAGGGGRSPKPLLPLPVWPSTWIGPPSEGWGSFPQLFRKALKETWRGSSLPGRCYAGTHGGSRHVFFNSRLKGERRRRGAGQVNARRGFRTRGCPGPRSIPALGRRGTGRLTRSSLTTERGGGAGPRVGPGFQPLGNRAAVLAADLQELRTPGGKFGIATQARAAASLTQETNVCSPTPTVVRAVGFA